MMAGSLTGVWEAPVGVESQVVKLRRGDPRAFGEILEKYQHRMYRFLLRLVRDRALAEDLFQQTWLRVVERIGQYDPARNFEAWLFSVARNLAIDHFRRYRPESLDEPAGDGAGSVTRADLLASGARSPLDGVLAQERSEQMSAALGRLPLIYREILTLRFEEEMKIEEIAAAIGVPLSTVKTRLRRGMNQLREAFAGSAGGLQ
jgi:RNA polymerase sigma-70 factor (ECF subfamily)